MTEVVTMEVYKDAFGERIGLKYKYNADTNSSAIKMGAAAAGVLGHGVGFRLPLLRGRE
mgnify:CR=1 FL=1